MATIEPKRETIIKESFVLTYERFELEAIVANPKPWLREIKAVLDGNHQQPLKRAIGHASVDVTKAYVKAARKVDRIGKKKKPQKVTAKARPTVARTFQCKQCPRAFSSDGRLKQHERSAHDDVEIGSYKIDREESAE